MTLKIVQISDTHISKDVPQRGDDLKRCIQAINALQSPPELVIHTGDISHDALPEEYQSARTILDSLAMPYFVMAGNRDKRSPLLEEFADARYKLPAEGWVQYSIEYQGARLVIVDTVCERSNKGQICTARLDHLGAMLAADTKTPTTLFLHHTPFEATGIPDPYQFEDWSDVEKLTELLGRFDHVTGMYCGHVHRFIDGEIAGLPASAISCLAGDLRKGDVTDEMRQQPVFKELLL